MGRQPPVRTELDEALLLAISKMRNVWHQRMRSLELSPPQAITLRMLADTCLPMGSVADLLSCDASNMTGIADRLEERGYVERVADPTDRRVKLLQITKSGRRLLDVMDAPLIDEFEGIASLSAAEHRQLAALLTQAFS